MKPNFVFSKKPCPGIYDEVQARKIIGCWNKGIMYLKYMEGQQDNFFFWVWKNGKRHETIPVFDRDYVPRTFNLKDLSPLIPGNFFNYGDRLYFVMQDKKGQWQINEIEVCTTWLEAKAWCQVYGLEENANSYIARVCQITDSPVQPLKFLGYCWRLYDDKHLYHAPLFYDDFDKIKYIDTRELAYEMVEPEEVILHNFERWTVYQYEEEKFYICKSPCQLKINPIIKP